jgi:hypothetical protein
MFVKREQLDPSFDYSLCSTGHFNVRHLSALLGCSGLYSVPWDYASLHLYPAICHPLAHGARLHRSHASNPHRVRYVGHDAVDIPMCLLVNFFTLALSPEDKDFRTYTLDFLGAVPLLASVAMLDIDRHIQSTALAIFITAVGGAICQTVGGGVAYPIYFLLSILSFGTSNRIRRRDSRRAESVLFSLLSTT